MSEKLTPWFPSAIKPARAGAYEVKGMRVRHAGQLYANGYAWWTGSAWGYAQATPHAASEDGMHGTPHFAVQNKVWRGLAQKP